LIKFYIPLDTKPVISEVLLPANLSASTEKTKNQKPGAITTKIYNKPRLTEYK